MSQRGPFKTALGHFNTWCLSRLDGTLHKALGARKRALFRDLPKRVLEIGPGLGANFRYYPAGTRVTALEPSPFMHDSLHAAASRYDIELEIVEEWAEKLSLQDACVDAVVGTLVLCSVRKPVRVMEQVHRVLAPRGRFIFLEHVGAPRGSVRRRVQGALAPPWRVVFEGCEPNRDTRGLIERTGFSEVQVEEYVARSPYYPINSQIAGWAIK